MANRDREDPRLLGAIDAAIDELEGDEAGHPLELWSELGVDPAHELLAAVRRDVVLADACVHRLSFDRAFRASAVRGLDDTAGRQPTAKPVRSVGCSAEEKGARIRAFFLAARADRH